MTDFFNNKKNATKENTHMKSQTLGIYYTLHSSKRERKKGGKKNELNKIENIR